MTTGISTCAAILTISKFQLQLRLPLTIPCLRCVRILEDVALVVELGAASVAHGVSTVAAATPCNSQVFWYLRSFSRIFNAIITAKGLSEAEAACWLGGLGARCWHDHMTVVELGPLLRCSVLQRAHLDGEVLGLWRSRGCSRWHLIGMRLRCWQLSEGLSKSVTITVWRKLFFGHLTVALRVVQKGRRCVVFCVDAPCQLLQLPTAC